MNCEVDVEFMLPALNPAAKEIRINCSGRVVRVQDSPEFEAQGFAIAGNIFEIERPGSA